MLSCIEYIEDNGICVYRCYGEGSFLVIPDRVDGRPVTSLADHVFAAEPSRRLRSAQKKRAGARLDDTLREVWLPEEGSALAEDLKPMAAEDLRTIVLPGTLREIGDYAFYGCRNLRSVTMSASLEKLGGGAFVAANRVEELIFVADEIQPEDEAPGRSVPEFPKSGSLPNREMPSGADRLPGREMPAGAGRLPGREMPSGADRLPNRPGQQLPSVPALRHVLGEIAYEVESRIVFRDGRDLLRLHFPEFYEDAVENTPARIFEMKFEGTGYKYRQCFKGEVPDLPRYDSLFYEASVQEFPPTVMMILCDRLLYPHELGPAAKRAYLSYLRENMESFVRWCFDSRRTGPDAVELMRCLCGEAQPDGEPFFDRESLLICLAAAREHGRADAAILLEDHKRRHFAKSPAERRYML